MGNVKESLLIEKRMTKMYFRRVTFIQTFKQNEVTGRA